MVSVGCTDITNALASFSSDRTLRDGQARDESRQGEGDAEELRANPRDKQAAGDRVGFQIDGDHGNWIIWHVFIV